jgi:hypothetical protein
MARKTHYVNGKDLYLAMVAYKERVEKAKNENKPLPIIPNYVGVCFMLICNNLANKPNFIGYTYKDEMIADAIENCVAAAHSFDPKKSNNPFAYFTQIAWNAFLRRMQKEKKQTYVKHKNFEYINLLDDLVEETKITGQNHNNEYSSEIIKSFEEKLTKTQKKSKIGLEKFVEEPNYEELTPDTSERT